MELRCVEEKDGKPLIYSIRIEGDKVVKVPVKVIGDKVEELGQPVVQSLTCPKCNSKLEVLDRPLAVYVSCRRCDFLDFLGYKVR